MSPVGADVIPLLQRSPLFATFDQSVLPRLAERFSEMTFPPESEVIGAGSSGPDFFVLVQGSAEVVRDGGVVAKLGAGDFFGEVAALDDGPRTASVRTQGGARCAALPQGSFKPFLLENPMFAVNLLNQMVRRFRSVVSSRPAPTTS